MAEQTPPPAHDLPPAQSCRLIDFERADAVSLMIYPPRPPTLVVAGQKPFANMQVPLNPLRYTRRPEYRGIEVVGCLPPIGQPAIVPYVAELDLTGIAGTRGVEVVGADRAERIDLPSAAETGPAADPVEDDAPS